MSLRIKLLAPLAVAGGLVLAAFVHAGGSPLSWALAAAAMAALAAAAVLVERAVVAPLRELAEEARARAGGADSSGDDAGADAVGVIARALRALGARLEQAEARSQREGEARRKADAELLDLRERYVMAVDRASDGIWEWDIRSGRVEFSPRWRGMLGFGDLGPRNYAEWEALVHPEDRRTVALRMKNHVQALTPHFDAEYRLRDGRGSYRWIYSRGAAIRHATHKPYRLVMVDHDIHARKQLEETLIHAAEGLSDVSGESFFRKLILSLSEILSTRDNLVAYCLDDPPTRVRTLAYLSKGRFWEPFEYELEGTSCGAVIDRRQTVYCPTGVCDLWPTEKQYDRDSYIGVPMFDSNGRIIGHFACMDGAAMRQDLPHLAIFKIFSVRAAAELERMLLKNRIAELEKPEST
jgi:PAS domain S-box-containing protein